MASFSKTFDFNLRRDHQKNFLWASRLWVGRRKEPILGYVPKNDEKKNSGGKGLMLSCKDYHVNNILKVIFVYKWQHIFARNNFSSCKKIIFITTHEGGRKGVEFRCWNCYKRMHFIGSCRSFSLVIGTQVEGNKFEKEVYKLVQKYRH